MAQIWTGPTVVPLSREKVRRKVFKPVYPINHNLPVGRLVPIMSTAVLPGESLAQTKYQALIRSDALSAKTGGAFFEMFAFYVKLSQIMTDDHLDTFFTTREANLPANYKTDTANPYFFQNGAVGATRANWTQLAYNVVVDEYFREDGKTSADNLDANSLAILSLRQNSAFAHAVDNYSTGNTQDVDLDADGVVEVGEVERALADYRQQRIDGMDKDITYEDYLRREGIRIPKRIVDNKPELIRYSRDWVYPVVRLDAATGTTNAMWQWSINSSADKTRFFKEPGIFLMVAAVRPKAYLSNQVGSFLQELDDSEFWMKSQDIETDPWSTFLKFDANSRTISGLTASKYLDMRNLWMFGEQFNNSTTSDAFRVALPDTNGNMIYPTETMIDAVFDDPTNAKKISLEGMVRCTRQVPLNPATPVDLPTF